MKIRFIQNYRLYRVGDEIETSEARAKELIAEGVAVAEGQEVRTAVKRRPAKVETAAAPTAEG